MSHLLDDDDDLMPRRERELTLSTGSILAIFFGLVLICGLFFAFGYNLGSKAHAPQLAATDDSTASSSSANFNTFKPSAGSPVGSSATPLAKDQTPVVTTPPPAAANVPKQPAPAEDAPVNDPPAPRPTPVTIRPTAAPVELGPATPGNYVVQIAAVSHQEDATLLVDALRGKGYSVAAKTEPQDKLFHIQVGPFSNRRDAEAMRQRLLADGYNALVK